MKMTFDSKYWAAVAVGILDVLPSGAIPRFTWSTSKKGLQMAILTIDLPRGFDRKAIQDRVSEVIKHGQPNS